MPECECGHKAEEHNSQGGRCAECDCNGYVPAEEVEADKHYIFD